MRFLLLVLAGIAWVGLPGALIGWIAGFFNSHIVIAVLWGLFILYTYPRSRLRWGGKVDALTYLLALVQAVIGGMTAFVVGEFTH
jgi:hypothetical protein